MALIPRAALGLSLLRTLDHTCRRGPSASVGGGGFRPSPLLPRPPVSPRLVNANRRLSAARLSCALYAHSASPRAWIPLPIGFLFLVVDGPRPCPVLPSQSLLHAPRRCSLPLLPSLPRVLCAALPGATRTMSSARFAATRGVPNSASTSAMTNATAAASRDAAAASPFLIGTC